MYPLVVLLSALVAGQGSMDPIKVLMANEFDDHPDPFQQSLVRLTQLFAFGVDTAFHEANANGALGGRQVTLVRHQYGDAEMKSSGAGLPAVLAHSNVNIHLTPSYSLAPALLAVQRTSTIPIFAPEAALADLFNQSKAQDVVHLRPNILSEITQLVNFAVNSRFRCQHIIVSSFKIGLLEDAAVLAQQILQVRLGLKPPEIHFFTSLDPANYTAELLARSHAYLAENQVAPSCFLFLAPWNLVRAAVREVTADKRLYHRALTAFLTISDTRTLRWELTEAESTDHPYPGTEAFRNLFHTNLFPHPTDQSFLITHSFKAAREAYEADSGNAQRTADELESRTTLRALEGYATGRMLVEAYRRNGRPQMITKKTVPEVVFRTRSFRVDDMVLGPYGGGCVGAQDESTGPCWCNSGIKQIFMTRVNGSTGKSETFMDDPRQFESGVGQANIPLTQCTFGADFLKPSRGAIAFVDAADMDEFDRVLRILAPMGKEMLAARGDGRFNRYYVFPFLAGVTPDADAAMISWLAQRRIAGYMAVSATPRRSLVARLPMIVAGSLEKRWPERDPGYTRVEDWRANVLGVLPVLADFIDTGVSYARRIDRVGHVHVVADTASLVSLATRSVNSHGVGLASSVVLPKDGTAAANQLKRGIDDATDGIIIVATQRPEALAVMYDFAAATGGVPVVLATSEFLWDLHQPPISGALPPSNLMIASGLATGFVHSPAANGDPASPANLTVFDRHQLYGEAIGQLTVATATLGADQQNGSPEKAVEVLYASGGVSAAHLSLGRLSKAACPELRDVRGRPLAELDGDVDADNGGVWPHPGGDCQCSKGILKFFLHRADGSEARPVHKHEYSGCGVQYTPLPPAAAGARDMTAMVVASSVSFGVFLLAVVAVVVYCLCCRTSGRDNRNAPKDESKPFAMVFTDIQASTTLWARVPQQMGPAIDAHHAILRDLVTKFKGYEVKTIGDSFMVAFSTAQAALEFALAIQGAFFDHKWGTDLFDETYKELIAQKAEEEATKQTETVVTPQEGLTIGDPLTPATAFSVAHYDKECWRGIRVRVGVHFGEGEIKQDPTTKGYDYYGTVVNTAARVEGVAHGGQVLLTKAAMDEVTCQGECPIAETTAIVTDLGPQPLRGLDNPVALIQLLPPRFAARIFPALRLDVENHVAADGTSEDDAGNRQDGADSRATGRSSLASEAGRDRTMDMLISDLASRQRVRGGADFLRTVYLALKTGLSSSQPAFQRQAIRKLAEQWRIPKQAPRWLRPYERRNDTVDITTVQLAARVANAMVANGHDSNSESAVSQPTSQAPRDSAMTHRSNDTDCPKLLAPGVPPHKRLRDGPSDAVATSDAATAETQRSNVEIEVIDTTKKDAGPVVTLAPGEMTAAPESSTGGVVGEMAVYSPTTDEVPVPKFDSPPASKSIDGRDELNTTAASQPVSPSSNCQSGANDAPGVVDSELAEEVGSAQNNDAADGAPLLRVERGSEKI